MAANFSSGGLACSVDIETGIIITPLMNKQFAPFFYHLITNKKIIGLEIPFWNIVKSEVKEMACLLPNNNYVGWDIAITSDSIKVIEANNEPAHSIIQQFDQIGKYQYIKSIL